MMDQIHDSLSWHIHQVLIVISLNLKTLLILIGFALDEESDITLESFLSQIWNFNKNNTKEKQKGIKLDFKSTDVFTNSLSILNKMWNSDYEIWLNAGN